MCLIPHVTVESTPQLSSKLLHRVDAVERYSATLDFLARFFSKVADQEKTNRMNAKGLAVVLSPNLLRNPEGDPLVFKVRQKL